ncbi:hypothetical protein [Paenibacillus rhizoplanae]|uniref:Uncharacterized protein n=1 Tax=Paenibacillus rhizoplanae TaxID=1917181 RepID=A0ABW5FDV9_9BACL
MLNLITIVPASIEVPSYPSRVSGRTASRNRRQALRSALWPIAKASVVLLGIFVKEAFL